MDPISAVKNCHIPGLVSFILDENRRIFAANNWTTLAANDFGDAVGVHNHHRNISIKVLSGELMNIEAGKVWKPAPIHPYNYRKWIFDSKLRGGAGSFRLDDTGYGISPEMEFTLLTPGSRTLYLDTWQLHTVKQLTKLCVWEVTESGPSTVSQTENWSRMNLTNWGEDCDYYIPMSHGEMMKAWSVIKSTVPNVND